MRRRLVRAGCSGAVRQIALCFGARERVANLLVLPPKPSISNVCRTALGNSLAPRHGNVSHLCTFVMCSWAAQLSRHGWTKFRACYEGQKEQRSAHFKVHDHMHARTKRCLHCGCFPSGAAGHNGSRMLVVQLGGLGQHRAALC